MVSFRISALVEHCWEQVGINGFLEGIYNIIDSRETHDVSNWLTEAPLVATNCDVVWFIQFCSLAQEFISVHCSARNIDLM